VPPCEASLQAQDTPGSDPAVLLHLPGNLVFCEASAAYDGRQG
jgi:hypothetical protein